MKINACARHRAVFVALVSSVLVWPTSGNSEPRLKPRSAYPLSAVSYHDREVPSRLATAGPQLRTFTQETAVVPNEIRRQKKAVRLVPREAPAPISESSNNNIDTPDVYAILLQQSSENGDEVPPIPKSINESKVQDAISPQVAPNGTVASGSVTTSKAPSKATLSTEKPSPANHSTGGGGGVSDLGVLSSQLVLSVQTASGSYNASNISDIERASNATGNQSTVVITNTHEIEVVIIAEGPPEPVPQPAPPTELPLLPEAGGALSRRFPSGLLYQNDTFVGARRPLPDRYPAHHYWAVYLTLTLLSLSVLAICLVCCTPQGRRDMSIPPPKPAQYGQLPPYSYAFSYDMRQAESQEIDRLNPDPQP